MEARGYRRLGNPPTVPDTEKLVPTPVTQQIPAELCTQEERKLLPKEGPVQEYLVQLFNFK